MPPARWVGPAPHPSCTEGVLCGGRQATGETNRPTAGDAPRTRRCPRLLAQSHIGFRDPRRLLTYHMASWPIDAPRFGQTAGTRPPLGTGVKGRESWTELASEHSGSASVGVKPVACLRPHAHHPVPRTRWRLRPMQCMSKPCMVMLALQDAGDAAKAALGLAGPANMRIEDGIFKDRRWINGEGKGRWDLEMFPKTSKGEPDWDLVSAHTYIPTVSHGSNAHFHSFSHQNAPPQYRVTGRPSQELKHASTKVLHAHMRQFTACDIRVIDAEIARRKMLEATPIASRNEDPVNFDTSEIPAWAWIKRFHLPEAEKLNGRAAMMGYVIAGAVDLMGGSGLVDQQESFFGKLALHVVVFAILIVRSTSDLDKYKGLLDEATFYDKQWNSTWEGTTRPSETQQ
eukprot:357715-Chlamydomonas_euryale.AAC.13